MRLGSPCKCGQRDQDDLVLCSIRGHRFVVQCKLCGEQWATVAKYAVALSMDYDLADFETPASPPKSRKAKAIP